MRLLCVHPIPRADGGHAVSAVFIPLDTCFYLPLTFRRIHEQRSTYRTECLLAGTLGSPPPPPPLPLRDGKQGCLCHERCSRIRRCGTDRPPAVLPARQFRRWHRHHSGTPAPSARPSVRVGRDRRLSPDQSPPQRHVLSTTSAPRPRAWPCSDNAPAAQPAASSGHASGPRFPPARHPQKDRTRTCHGCSPGSRRYWSPSASSSLVRGLPPSVPARRGER
jgi:hypothetical protein